MEIKSMKLFYLVFGLLFVSCGENNDTDFRYNGRMEAETIMLTARQVGEIDSVFVKEGQTVEKGQLLAVLDQERLMLQQQMQNAQLEELKSSRASLLAQKKQVEAQRSLVLKNLEKTRRMVKKGAATEQALDNLSTQKDVYDAQLLALESQFSILNSKQDQLMATENLTRLSLDDARIKAPIHATILAKYHSVGENAAPGVPLFELADLRELKATIYVPIEEVAKINMGDVAKVFVDGMAQPLEGKVSWIASESEFTPKTILTKETRSTLVYAVEILLPNTEGILKIGMPVEVTL
jgi:membrane fusion protein YbhG